MCGYLDLGAQRLDCRLILCHALLKIDILLHRMEMVCKHLPITVYTGFKVVSDCEILLFQNDNSVILKLLILHRMSYFESVDVFQLSPLCFGFLKKLVLTKRCYRYRPSFFGGLTPCCDCPLTYAELVNKSKKPPS